MRYGIFGGSFNPVHNGHVIIANLVLEYLKLDLLYVVPAKIPPHKIGERIVGFNLRYRWIRKVFEGSKKIVVSDVEGKRKEKSYTIYTIEHFISVHKEKPYLIIGSDNALNFDKWFMYERIIELSKVCVYPRRGYERRSDSNSVDLEKFEWLDLPLIDISASAIRRRIIEGKPIDGYVPKSIIDEILEVYTMM